MPHPRVSKKPQGQPTRGKTASNRLRWVDNFVLLYEPSLLTRTDGPMIEGTSNPFVTIWCANVVRRVMESGSLLPAIQEQQAPGLYRWRHGALVFSSNFRLGFDVEEFQTILPKNLIHRVVEGELIFDFFEAWKAAAAATSALKAYGARQWFIAAAEGMVERGYTVASQRKWLAKGFLIWKLEPGE